MLTAKETLHRLDFEAIRIRDDTTISNPVLEETRRHTIQDDQCQRLIRAIRSRTPTGRDPTLTVFAARKDDIRVDNSIVFIDRACFIPGSLRREMLQRAHRSHLGFEATFRRTQGVITWPGIKNDIKSMVEACQACQTYSIRQQREPLICGEVPKHPWDIIHQDVFEWKGQQYVVTVDGFSNYFHVARLERPASAFQIITIAK